MSFLCQFAGNFLTCNDTGKMKRINFPCCSSFFCKAGKSHWVNFLLSNWCGGVALGHSSFHFFLTDSAVLLLLTKVQTHYLGDIFSRQSIFGEMAKCCVSFFLKASLSALEEEVCYAAVLCLNGLMVSVLSQSDPRKFTVTSEEKKENLHFEIE